MIMPNFELKEKKYAAKIALPPSAISNNLFK